jgi:predicted dehydrogenase
VTRGGVVSQSRLRVGIIGTGLIAQVMHLHYLTELADRFEVAAVCDLATENARELAGRYCAAVDGSRPPAVFADWRELLAEPLDAILVLTSGSHAPIAIAAAGLGVHVFTEKPMCFSVAEGKAMVAAAERAGTTLMVGYPKRYDPAYTRFAAEIAGVRDGRLFRVTTFESPFASYVGHYPLLPPAKLPHEVTQGLRADDAARISDALGADATETDCRIYADVLLDTLVHELNTVRGVLGEPNRLEFADLSPTAVSVLLRFGDLPVSIQWLDLPGISRYAMEFALFAPDRRVTLTFPSPFLRNEPAALQIEAGDAATSRSWRTEEVVSYDSGFRRELVAFHESITTGTEPATSGRDGLADIALCQSIIECHRLRRPIDAPSRYE